MEIFLKKKKKKKKKKKIKNSRKSIGHFIQLYYLEMNAYSPSILVLFPKMYFKFEFHVGMMFHFSD